MSLKAFHVVFITAACALAFGFGVWELKDYRLPGGELGNLLLALGSFVVGVSLIVYERYVLKKLKNEGYL